MSYPNHGVQLLRQALSEREWTQTHAESVLTKPDGARLSPGYLSRLIVGDRLPGRHLAIQLRDLLGVPVDAWDEPPTSEDAAQ